MLLGNSKKILFNIFSWLIFLAAGHWFVHGYHEFLSDRYSLGVSLGSQVGLIFLLFIALLVALQKKSQRFGQYPLIMIWIAMIVIAHNLVFIDDVTREDTLAALNLGKSLVDLVLITALYAAILAIPFMPGLELGLVIMALFGTSGVTAAYLGTLLGLVMAYSVGRWIAHAYADNPVAIGWANSDRLERFVGPRLSTLAVKYRYIILGLVFNIPGNSAVGGGGGISLMSGMSGRFTLPKFILTVMIATAPLPIFILSGVISVDSLHFSH